MADFFFWCLKNNCHLGNKNDKNVVAKFGKDRKFVQKGSSGKADASWRIIMAGEKQLENKEK